VWLGPTVELRARFLTQLVKARRFGMTPFLLWLHEAVRVSGSRDCASPPAVKGNGQECPLHMGKIKSEQQVPPSSE
jgi:hypothetical protein